MPSQFFGLNIGYTGLQAANAALNVTGNNISNVETEGYTRQKAVQEAARALRTNTSYGMAGAGVDTTSIDQEREAYYDTKYRANNASLGIYEIKEKYYRQIEDYFTESDQVEGFNKIFNEVFDALDEVYKSSGDDTKIAEFLAETTTLTEYFNAMSTNLKKLQTDANDEILNKVNEINALASEIATINKQINTIEINKTRANELRDKRNLLVDQLSKIVDVEVKEIPIPITEGSSTPSGIYRYIINIAGGQNLVNSYDYSTVTVEARNMAQKANQSDADGLYDIFINDIALNLYGGSLGGELKGLLEVRDGNNGENFAAKGASVTCTAPSGSDPSKVTVVIEPTNPNYDFLTNMNKSTLNSGGTIVVGNKEFEYDSWTYDNDTKTYVFSLSAGEDASSYDGRDVRIGTSIDYQGIPYYQAQMNEWIRGFAQAMNKIELNAEDDYGNQTESIFAYGTDQNQFDDYYEKNADGTYKRDANGDVIAKTITDSSQDQKNYQKLTAENFRVNKHMVDDVNKFGTTVDITKGQDAQDITEELLKVKNDKSKMTFRGCSAREFLQCLTADVALGAASANNFSTNFNKISSAIVAQRTSVSGVDNDEEALNLVKFQEAYNLASKMIQVMTEVYDRLILNTGV